RRRLAIRRGPRRSGRSARRGGLLVAMVCGTATRGTRTPTPPAPGRRIARVGPLRSSRRWPRTAFWVRVALEEFRRSAVHRDLGLELADALLRRRELGSFAGAQARLEALVDAVLATPVVDRLIADPEILRDVCDASPRADQFQHSTAKLRRVTPSSHVVLLEDNSHSIQKPDSTEPGADQSSRI